MKVNLIVAEEWTARAVEKTLKIWIDRESNPN